MYSPARHFFALAPGADRRLILGVVPLPQAQRFLFTLAWGRLHVSSRLASRRATSRTRSARRHTHSHKATGAARFATRPRPVLLSTASGGGALPRARRGVTRASCPSKAGAYVVAERGKTRPPLRSWGRACSHREVSARRRASLQPSVTVSTNHGGVQGPQTLNSHLWHPLASIPPGRHRGESNPVGSAH